MSLQTNLIGRLRNLSLPKSHGLLPVFEAVVNSIHAIEENGLCDDGEVILEINRDTQENFNFEDKNLPQITGFTIKDNGCGFNSKNFSSFKTLDSDYKITKGCRGVGRLTWLKACDLVEVESNFLNNDNLIESLSFKFGAKLGLYNDKAVISKNLKSGTVVKLVGFNNSYRESVSNKTKTIANLLLEHILWYFVRDQATPKIFIKDLNETLNLDELYDEYMHDSTIREEVNIHDFLFEFIHVKFRASVNKNHQLSLCAANRLVKEEVIRGKIPGLYEKIADEKGEFTYNCYISSPYLDENVRSERTDFNIPEKFDDMLQDISLSDIREKVLDRAQLFLKDVLEENIAKGRKRVDDFISQKAPRYRPILSRLPDSSLVIDPKKTDKELELHLHAHWYEIERELVREGHDIMQPKHDEHTDEYKVRLNEYLNKAEDLKKSDLVNYVSHRKVIIDLLQKSIERQENGKYAREDMIHELIMPMRKDSSEVFNDSCNLWLIDERLAFHSYLASDKTLNSMPITGCESNKEPDLLSLRVFDNPILVNNQASLPLAAITVIEIKRPMRNDMSEGEEKDPIDQALGYLERVREGKIITPAGRPIPSNKDIPGYCYILCDLTSTMQRRCRRANLRVTSDGMGYFGYNEPSHAYIEVISFDQLVKGAKERNRAFFDKLGLPTT